MTQSETDKETIRLLAEAASKPRNEALICAECGADFTCRTGDPGECWCNTSPNIRPQFRLDGTCVCPNCLAMGQWMNCAGGTCGKTSASQGAKNCDNIFEKAEPAWLVSIEIIRYLSVP